MVATTSFSTELHKDEEFWLRCSGPPHSLNLWTPPEDPYKTRLPYISGFSVPIRRHVPPPPFGGPDYGFGPRQELSQDYLYSLTQSELVVEHPVLETPLPAQIEAAQLTITTPIAIGSVRGAQVVSCVIAPKTEGSEPFQAVAKIFDPLYYNFEWSFSHQPQDTVWQADSDYSREAAAYEHLQKTENLSSFAPAYYGSWTFNLPISIKGVASTRAVCMILMECLENGKSILNTRVRNSIDPDEDEDAFHYPEDYRLEVLAIAMDHYVQILHSGLDQADFAGRNIILVPNTEPTTEVPVISGLPLPRVVLVDYNTSVVCSLAAKGKNLRENSSLPINPLQLWWGMPLNEFAGWVPHEWHETPRLKREWLKERFGGADQRKLYTMRESMEFLEYD